MGFCSKTVSGVISAAIFGASTLAATAVPTVAAAQIMSAAATVRIAIQIGPIVEVSFPEGTDFSIEVVENSGPQFGGSGAGLSRPTLLAPATIPFEVRGNAHAVVSAIPGEVSKAFDAANPTGIARLSNQSAHTSGNGGIEYRTFVEFPDEYRDNISTHGSTVKANVATGPLRGVVHVIPLDVSKAPVGRYSGAIQMVVYAEE